MNSLEILSTLFILLFIIRVNGRNECLRKTITNSDSVCVCNSSYCDDFPPISRPTDNGTALVFESNKFGDRFKEIQIKANILYKNSDFAQSVDITIDKSLEYQRIHGFGGAFTDTTGMLLKSVSESLSNSIIKSYFSKNGIEYSFGRVPVSGTDYSVRSYTYDDYQDDENLTHFSLQNEDFQWKIPFIKLAQEVSPHRLKLIGTSWSPPAWMKKNNQIKSFSGLKGEIGGHYYQIYANYIVKFLKSYQQNGIEFWGMTTQNEPAQDHNINGLNMTAEQQREYVNLNLGPTLLKNGFSKDKLKLLIFDDTTPHMREYADTILKDDRSFQYVSGMAMHWYYNEMMGPFPGTLLDYLYQNYPEYFVINTEACSLKGADNGRWDYAENYAFDIIRDLNHWVIGWIEWNMVLDMDGGPTWMQKHGCGGLVYVDPQVDEAYKQPTFYALGQFSKFISPESVRIYHEMSQQINGLSVLTVKRPDNAIVVIVLNSSDQKIIINLIDSKHKYFTHYISGHSIQTYIWWD